MFKIESIENYRHYCHLFKNYKLNNQLTTTYQVVYRTKIALLRLYPATCKIVSNKFLLIPSIINDLTIFDIPRKSFINFLQQQGDVYVIEWLDITAKTIDYNINDYVLEITTIITKALTDQVVNLIGYCLGGNLAIAVAILLKQQIKSLILFATPWNFNYINIQVKLLKHTKLIEILESLDVVPASYLQILFFLLEPDKTLTKFFTAQKYINSEEFYTVERWLYSEKNMTKAVFKQLINDFVLNKQLNNNAWFVTNQCINPTAIIVPVLTLLGTKDKIVAPSAVRALYSKLPNTYNIEIAVGHIGFFIGRQQQQLFSAIKQWIKDKL